MATPIQRGRGKPDPTGARSRPRAIARPDRAGVRPVLRIGKRRKRQRGIGRRIATHSGKALVTPILQIKQDGRRHNRHMQPVAKIQPVAPPRQLQRHGIRRRQAENTAARQHQRMHPLDQRVGLQRIGLARARPAAAHIHAHHHRSGRPDHGDPGFRQRAMRMPDANPGRQRHFRKPTAACTSASVSRAKARACAAPFARAASIACGWASRSRKRALIGSSAATMTSASAGLN